ncbi:condensation domain-containing protein, partial [uncultured Mycolicibacterium sp.]|uniref:condensation domain-containing protein n=1 Tax=uncultured Mycolicibacterium sp. TaxID=2320817 RepID=UPI0026270804
MTEPVDREAGIVDELTGRALPLTRAQLDIWLEQELGRLGADWQLGLLVRIDGPVEYDALQWAIQRVVEEAEPVRVAIHEQDGRVLQTPVDFPDVPLEYVDLTEAADPADEVRRRAAAIQREPMPLSGPLFRFVLFQTRDDEYYLFACFHHIVIDGTGLGLIGNRIAAVYSAAVSGEPIPPAFFGTLRDLVDLETAYEQSADHAADRDYWLANLPSEDGSSHQPAGPAPSAGGADEPSWPTEPVPLDPSIVARVDELAEAWNMPRASIITAACAVLFRHWSTEGSDIVLDLPVSRRVTPEARTLPGMLAGVVPLVLSATPDTTVADFCRHVDGRIQEALSHQRFPAYSLDRADNGPDRRNQRVVVDFLPLTFALDFAGVRASAMMTNSGFVGGFGLVFSGLGDELALSTLGHDHPLADVDVTELARRLERVLVGFVGGVGVSVSGVS